MDWFMVLSWGSPVGIAVLLAGLGIFFWGLSKTGWTRDE